MHWGWWRIKLAADLDFAIENGNRDPFIVVTNIELRTDVADFSVASIDLERAMIAMGYGKRRLTIDKANFAPVAGIVNFGG